MEMPDFLNRFGQRSSDGTAHFSNVRKGLIVGLVYLTNLIVLFQMVRWLTFPFIAPQLSIGTLIGALVAAPIADRIGRRLSISVWCVVVSIGFVIQIASVTAWYQVMIGRLVAGFGVGALSLLVPMYQGAETILSRSCGRRLF